MRKLPAPVLKYVFPSLGCRCNHCNPDTSRSSLVRLQGVSALCAEAISGSVLVATVGTGIEQRATACTIICIRFIRAFACGAEVNWRCRSAIYRCRSKCLLCVIVSAVICLDCTFKSFSHLAGMLITVLRFFLERSQHNIS